MEKGSGATPVHRKDGNRAKVKEKVKELKLGDLVLCKIKGLRQWPGKIIRPEEWERTPEPEKFLVKFFGTSEIAFVAPADIRLFTSASKRKLLAQRHSKVFKYFCSAVDEVCEAFENKLRKSSSDPVEVNDGNSIILVSSSTEVFPEAEVNEAQPVVSGGKPLGGNEGDGADLVDNESLAIVLYSKKGQELEKPAKVNVCKKRKPISETKVKELLNVTKRSKNLSEIYLSPKGIEKVRLEKDESLMPERSSSSREHREKKLHNVRNKKHKTAATDDSRPAKRLKGTKDGNDMVGVVHKDVRKQAAQSASENRQDTFLKRKKPRSSSKGQKPSLSITDIRQVGNNKLAEDAAFPLSERCSALEAASKSSINNSVSCERSSGKGEDVLATNCDTPPTTYFRNRRRTFQVNDEEDEEQQTPVHQGENDKVFATSNSDANNSCLQPENSKFSARNSNHSASRIPNSLREDKSSGARTSPVQVGTDSPPGRGKVLAINKERATGLSNSYSLGKPESKPSSRYSRKNEVYSKSELTLGGKHKTIIVKPVMDEIKASGNTGKNIQFGSPKSSSQASESLNYTHNLATLPKEGLSSSLEKAKLVSKTNLKMTATTERSGVATTSSLSRGLLHDYLISGPVPTPVVHGTTAPSTTSAIHMLTSGSSVHTYAQDFVTSASFGPSPKASHQISSFGPSNGSRVGCVSCDADAAVARDGLERMMETLSRTKESIGRATRLAIGCAKYGIASEVIDLIIRKLEGESNFRRKVDLFFLVDSITQCSHSQKGIAGASYIPAVQAALPRLLGAAVPSGASACENRHQCLKVLRLWVERRIMPEAVLHQYMHYLEAPKDDRNSGSFLRSVDDPIREMEGVLGHENGSNAAFRLPGPLSHHVFECEDIPRGLCKNSGKELMVESDIALAKGGNCVFAPSKKRHHILKDVDGELEMEDVCMVSEEEKGVLVYDSNGRQPCQFSGGSSQSSLNNLAEAQPLSMGPSLPLNYPPPPPTLVPPPPPLPLLPPPLPPPPPKSSPPPPGFPPSQYFPPPRPSLSPSFTYCPPMAQEHCRPPCCNQGAQMTRNVAIHGHGTVSANAEGVLLQPPTSGTTNLGTLQPMPGFTPRPSEYGRNDMYITSEHSHNPQFQSSSGSFQQGPYHSLPSQQAPTNYPHRTVQAPPNYPLPNHPLATAQAPPNRPLPTAETQMNSFASVNPLSQQNYQQPYSPYSHANVGGRGQNVLDEQRRVHSTDSISDGRFGDWVARGEGPSSSDVHFPQDGFYRSNMERPHQNSVYQHPPLQNSMPSGPSVPVPLSHAHPHHLPPSDVPALNWRSA
ncbi:hypothetical protein J5N97_029059 [Dioscorea zingiberensis]|uniref:ENHANCER OF AG-4 protein 2 n=1 Tax=Dioscorea zingiberensis TaxID=325984 RepID=A0A9D5BZL2_9LILI|nr:hypothetical protein J5N97_029059 [Dioscorea zingiberensis]